MMFASEVEDGKRIGPRNSIKKLNSDMKIFLPIVVIVGQTYTDVDKQEETRIEKKRTT